MTSLKKRELYFWKSNYGISGNQLHLIPKEQHRFNFRDSEVNDDFLFWLTSRKKIVEQFDLDNSLITNIGVKYLSEMESIKELRLKGCHGIDKGCLGYLNKITSLQLLHIGSTAINLSDIKELKSLQKLKLLLVSSNEGEAEIKEKVAALKQLLLHCVINVNHNIIDNDSLL